MTEELSSKSSPAKAGLENSNDKINEVKSIKRTASVQQLRDKFSGPGVPDTKESFSKKGSFRKIPLFSYDKSQIKLLTSPKKNFLMQHWSQTVNEESNGAATTENAVQFLSHYGVTKDGEDTTNWEEWMEAIHLATRQEEETQRKQNTATAQEVDEQEKVEEENEDLSPKVFSVLSTESADFEMKKEKGGNEQQSARATSEKSDDHSDSKEKEKIPAKTNSSHEDSEVDELVTNDGIEEKVKILASIQKRPDSLINPLALLQPTTTPAAAASAAEDAQTTEKTQKQCNAQEMTLSSHFGLLESEADTYDNDDTSTYIDASATPSTTMYYPTQEDDNSVVLIKESGSSNVVRINIPEIGDIMSKNEYREGYKLGVYDSNIGLNNSGSIITTLGSNTRSRVDSAEDHQLQFLGAGGGAGAQSMLTPRGNPRGLNDQVNANANRNSNSNGVGRKSGGEEIGARRSNSDTSSSASSTPSKNLAKEPGCFSCCCSNRAKSKQAPGKELLNAAATSN